MNILIVDDDPLFSAIVTAILRDAGHQCHSLGNGRDALALLQSEGRFDCVVSDLNMPGLDGLELLGALREREITIPFILLSGDDPERVRERAPELTDCLPKDQLIDQRLPQAIAALAATP